jgi:hypothetical protein
VKTESYSGVLLLEDLQLNSDRPPSKEYRGLEASPRHSVDDFLDQRPQIGMHAEDLLLL